VNAVQARYDKLYEDSASKVVRKAELARQMLEEQHKECTFKPTRVAKKTSPAKSSPSKTSPSKGGSPFKKPSPNKDPDADLPAFERLSKLAKEQKLKT
jgi:hypothetical protein